MTLLYTYNKHSWSSARLQSIVTRQTVETLYKEPGYCMVTVMSVIGVGNGGSFSKTVSKNLQEK